VDKPAYDPNTIAIGVLGKPHGIRGEIGLRLFNVAGPALTELASITIERDGKRQTHVVASARPFPGGLLIALAGITSREQAAALTHGQVRVARSSLPPPAPGEFYVADIPGCQVFGEDGTRLGLVRETFWNGAHDVMLVVNGDAPEQLIPLIPEFVRAVDVGARTVQVAWEHQETDQGG
jgi:16S rRNA processing protein RimM